MLTIFLFLYKTYCKCCRKDSIQIHATPESEFTNIIPPEVLPRAQIFINRDQGDQGKTINKFNYIIKYIL